MVCHSVEIQCNTGYTGESRGVMKDGTLSGTHFYQTNYCVSSKLKPGLFPDVTNQNHRCVFSVRSVDVDFAT